MDDKEFTKEKLLEAIIDANRDLSSSIIISWAKVHGYYAAFKYIFEPVLNTIGDLWYKNELSLAQGYLTGKVAEDVFMKASKDEQFNKTVKHKGNVVIGNVEDDFHSLGRKLLAVFLKADGWAVNDLGNDISAKEFVEHALATNSKIIGVSAMMYSTAKNIMSVREELNKQNLSGKIQLAVGGAIFKLRPELVDEVGGDGSCNNAIVAPNLFDSLMLKAKENE